MSAPIVFHLSRNPVSVLVPHTCSGDLAARYREIQPVQGQLWERLAESRLQRSVVALPLYTRRIAEAFHTAWSESEGRA